MKKVLAIDFGASSGRAIIGSFDGEKITLEEIHRFSNDPVSVNGTTYWDVLRLFHEIKQGLIKSKGCGVGGGIFYSKLLSIGVKLRIICKFHRCYPLFLLYFECFKKQLKGLF